MSIFIIYLFFIFNILISPENNVLLSPVNLPDNGTSLRWKLGWNNKNLVNQTYLKTTSEKIYAYQIRSSRSPSLLQYLLLISIVSIFISLFLLYMNKRSQQLCVEYKIDVTLIVAMELTLRKSWSHVLIICSTNKRFDVIWAIFGPVFINMPFFFYFSSPLLTL